MKERIIKFVRFYLRALWRFIRFQGRPIPFCTLVEVAEDHECGLLKACEYLGIRITHWDFTGKHNEGLDIPPNAWRARNCLRIGSVVVDRDNRFWTVLFAQVNDYNVEGVAAVDESVITPVF